jgi:hypothetical protein
MLFGEIIRQSERGLWFRVAGQLGDAPDFGISGDVWFNAGSYELGESAQFPQLKALRVSREVLLAVGRTAETVE